jgi:hypothetical protein
MLSKLEEMEKRAAPIPWEADEEILASPNWCTEYEDLPGYDTAFIAALRNAAPQLLAEVRALRQERDALRMRGLLGVDDVKALLDQGWHKNRVAGHLGMTVDGVNKLLRSITVVDAGPRCAHCGILLEKGDGWAVVVDGEDERGHDVRHGYCRDCVERLGLWVETWRAA